MVNNKLNLKLISVNVRGIHSYARRMCIFQWLKKMCADVIFLQETYSTYDIEKYWKCQWDGKIVQAHGTNHSKGVAILFKNNVDVDILSSTIDINGRYICLDVSIQDHVICLFNAYAPCSSKNKDQLTFFAEVYDVLSAHCKHGKGEVKNVIIGGDLNILMNSSLDRSGGNPVYNINVMDKVNEIIDTFDLIDIWRVCNPFLRQYTWRQNKPLIQSRLDYWLISDSMQDLVNSVKIKPAIKTDHSAIFLHLDKSNDSPHGPSYWKFNDSLCNDQDYYNLIEDNYPKWLEKYNTMDDYRILWELIKFELRSITQNYSKKKARDRNKTGKVLENKVNMAEAYMCSNPSDAAKNEWLKAKAELDNHFEHITQGIIIRSRATWYENGEKNNKFFLNLEKSNKNKSTIRKVLKDDGKLCTESKEVLNEIKNFYTTLYAKNDVDFISDDTKKFFEDIPKLSDEDQKLCEGKLSNDECFKALHTMKNGKSPGNDGLTSLFYKTYWHLFGNMIVNSLNTSYDKGDLSNSQKQGIITLILKKNKDKRKIGSYRPITLLNVDLKIGCKALSIRMCKIMPILIAKEQTAFVTGRYIGDAVRTVADILFYTKDYNIPGILLSIDFEKAYDSVNHKFLHKILTHYNFGKSFRNWIKILYNDTESCVMNNGVSTGYFKIDRGLRQGDPLSCQLFNLVIEVLCIHIQNRDDIQGIPIGPDKRVKLSGFADDLRLFLNNVTSAFNAINVLHSFRRCSGLKTNDDKTEAMWIGSARHRSDTPINVRWTKTMKILGIFFTDDDKEMIKLNYEDKLPSLKCAMGLWKHRDISVMGKITIAKTFGISQFLYTSSVVSMPIHIQNKINSILFHFIWNGPDRIKRTVLCGDYASGGLKMINLKSRVQTQNIMWLKRLASTTDAGWKDILLHYLKPFGGKDFLKCNIDVKKLKGVIPPFYLEALTLWFELTNFKPVKVDDVLNQTIWNNKFILIGKKMVYYSKFAEAGFHTLYDFIDDKGNWLKFSVLGKGFNNIDRLKWYGIINAIPKEWINLIRRSPTIPTIVKNNEIGCNLLNGFTPLENLKSRNMYKYFISNTQDIPITDYTLQTTHNLNEKECKDVYMIPFYSTICCKSRWFQYRTTHNILTTNSWLYRIKKIDSPLCELCHIENETIYHLFARCSITNSFWNEIEKRITLIPTLNDFMKIYGVYDKDVRHVKLVNQFLITARRCIYKCRCDGSKLSYKIFRNMLLNTIKLELIIAESNDKVDTHYKKWNPFLTEIS